MNKQARWTVLAVPFIICLMIGAGYLPLMDEMICTYDGGSSAEVKETPEQKDEYDQEKRGKLHPFNGGWVATTSGGITRYYDKDCRRDTSKTPRWYYNDALSKQGRIPTKQELMDWASQWGSQNVGSSADIMYVARDNPLDLKWTDRPGCSCDGDLNEDGSITTGNNGGVIYGWDKLYATLAMSDSAAIEDSRSDDKICFAEYESYNLSVNVVTTDNLNDVTKVELFLDYNTTNISFSYDWGSGQFSKSQDPNGHIQLNTQDCSIYNDNVENWKVNFNVTFNFTFPHEELIDCFVRIYMSDNDEWIDRYAEIFRVENDLELVGTPRFVGEYQGELAEGDWIRGNENITISGLTVRYAGGPMIYPVDDYFNVKVVDGGNNTWWDNESMGESVSIDIASRNVTDKEEEYVISIENIPGNGTSVGIVSFPVKIDAEAPPPPEELLCHADSFKDRETENTNVPMMYVTWDLVEDNASGLEGYLFSQDNNSGTLDGEFQNYTGIKLEKLAEGFSPIHVWCVDKVGNVGEAAHSGIFVDLTPPVFENILPTDGSWFNHSDIECSVDILDLEGSGVDGQTIEYSVSYDGPNNFMTWIPAWIVQGEEKLTPLVEYNFQEGTDNYIKWRAKDISENGYVESIPSNVKVDITPVEFSDELSLVEEWYNELEATVKIKLSDGGSGVNPDSIAARVSVDGPGSFGPWIRIDGDKISALTDEEYEIEATFQLEEGNSNYVMFRGTDMVGNPLTLSGKFNLKVDTDTVYFSDFTPGEETSLDDCRVECFIYIRDNGSGVDPKTVEYSVSTEGSDDKEFGPWKKAQNVVAGNPTQVMMEIKFEWGMENYIRWRADDRLGTGYAVSRSHRVWVNSKPDIEISSPWDDLTVLSDEDILFDASLTNDEDGDELSFYWSTNVGLNSSVGYCSTFTAKLVPGNHTITLWVSDGHENNMSKKIKINVGERKDDIEDDDDTPGSVFAGAGADNTLFWMLVGGSALVLLLVLLIFFMVMRKKKKKKEEDSTTPQAVYQPSYGPSPSPYSQGYHPPPATPQSYGRGSGTQPLTAARSAGYPGTVAPNRPMLPQGPQTAQTQYRQNPPTQLLPAGPGTAPGSDLSYLLPTFTTDQGDQNLARLALPPASVSGSPDMSMQSSMPPMDHTLTSPSPGSLDLQLPPLSPEPSLQTPIDMPGSAQGPSPLFPPKSRIPETPASPSPGIPETPASPPPGIPETPASPPPGILETPAQSGIPETPASPPPGISEPAPPSVQPPVEPGSGAEGILDEIFASSSQKNAPPPPDAPPSDDAPPKALTMQCHSCGMDYQTVISQLPAVVTCTHCGTQGMVESL